jgi:hypothetical protein
MLVDQIPYVHGYNYSWQPLLYNHAMLAFLGAYRLLLCDVVGGRGEGGWGGKGSDGGRARWAFGAATPELGGLPPPATPCHPLPCHPPGRLIDALSLRLTAYEPSATEPLIQPLPLPLGPSQPRLHVPTLHHPSCYPAPLCPVPWTLEPSPLSKKTDRCIIDVVLLM